MSKRIMLHELYGVDRTGFFRVYYGAGYFMGIKIIIGHTNMDLDCIGSIVLARYLFPGHLPVKSRFIHPMAKGIYHLYENQLNFLAVEDIRDETPERIVIVDTRVMDRVKEVFECYPDFKGEIEIYDHHRGDDSDFPGALVHEGESGSNTSLIAMELMNRSIKISPDDATVALAGIYADTGNFTHSNIQAIDFKAASFLMESGASTKILSTFMKALKEDHQLELFHGIVNQMVYQEINGNFIIFSYMAMEKQAGGLAAVVEKLFEIENPDAVFAIFAFKKDSSVLIIARSQKSDIDLDVILGHFGGGGHAQAASALLKHSRGRDVLETLLRHLKTTLIPALTAEEVMTKNVYCISAGWTLKEASIFLENADHGGAPVIDADNRIVGMLTLRDIMKGRKTGQINAPVKVYMKKKVISCSRTTTLREIEHMLYENNIGHLPVLDEGLVAGIITRSDILRFAEKL